MQRPFYTTLGDDLDNITLGTVQVEGIIVDNPSGSWLHVEGIDRYIPPYIMGWSFPVQPSMTSMTVRFVDSPSGSQSVQVGTPPTVYLLDTPVPAFSGTPSGAGGRVTTVPPSQTAFAALTADLPNLIVPVVVLTAVTGPIVIRKLAGTFDLRDLGGAIAGYDPKSVVSFFWEAQLGAVWAWQFAIGPESPSWTDSFSDGALFLPTNATLSCSAIVQFSGQEIVLGIPATQVMAMVEYYNEVDV